jgi:3-hydroxyisobutyrate dehydrogenase-like beta-hydroxyacid dehydrogenase
MLLDMEHIVSLIGFGEAGRTFANAGGWAERAQVFDRKTDSAQEGAAMRATFAQAGVRGARVLEDAVAGAELILSLVTADQALHAAQESARCISSGAMFCDCNSIAPQTKLAAAQMIEAAGGRYIDVAVMAPVNPLGLNVPLLLSGTMADEAKARLAGLGFGQIGLVGEAVGRASAIKMIRSVIVKGVEALTVECVLAAAEAGVIDEVLASLDASPAPPRWADRADYNLDRMMIHGLRRAAEMEEVVRTLDALGTGSAMTRGTVERQRALGALDIGSPPAGLQDKIAVVRAANADKEAQAA